MAEYEVLIIGLKTIISLGVHQLLVKGDFHLVINQIHRFYVCINTQLVSYAIKVKQLKLSFNVVHYIGIFLGQKTW